MIFLAPSFLFGLLAVAIPVIIHLVQLRKPQRVLFTNVAFIRSVENITANQRKLKHWLILLCRILFIVFLVLVFCEPFIPAKDNALAQTGNLKVYIDNSGSMQSEAEKGGMNLLELATDELASLQKQLPKQLQVQVLDNNFKSGANRPVSAENLNSHLTDISFAPVSRQTGIVYARLIGNKPSGNDQLFWFSDFQRSTFDPGFFTQSDSATAVHLVKLNSAASDNLFIDSVALEDELVRLNQNNRLLVKVFNTSPENKNGVSVKLFIGNRQVGANAIDLKAKSAGSIFIDFRLTDGSAQQARLVLEDQPVTFDNTYYLTLKPAAPIRILDITESALTNTSRLFTNEPLFVYSTQQPGRVSSQAIDNAAVVILNELPAISGSLADKLNKYVRAGGKLVFIPAPEIKTADYRAFFDRTGLPVTNVKTTNESAAQLALPDLKNPFFRNIFAEMDRRLQMPKSPVNLSWQRSDADMLVFKNGRKFLSQFQVGKGNISVFAAPFTHPENEFSRHALFVPVMYKLALASHKADQQLAYNFSQRTFSLPVPEADIRKNVFSLETDSSRFIPEQTLRNGQMYFTIPAEMAEAGFYRLKHSDSTLTTLAFNYPKQESYLDAYSAEELRQLIPGKQVRIYEAGGAVSFSDQFARQAKGTPLWQYFLVAGLFFLLAEILLIRFL